MIENKENVETPKKVVTTVIKKTTKPEINKEPINQEVEVKPIEKKEKTYEEMAAEAQANVALKAVLETNSTIANNKAEKSYLIEKQKYMLNKCKTDKKVKFTGEKILAPYFGKVWSFYYNCIPVTVYFDGVPREYPEFIVERIKSIISDVSESNTYKEIIDEL